jgi:site-specific DNA-cytosine methylase
VCWTLSHLSQALGIRVNTLSASDPNLKNKAVVDANLKSKPTHWFRTMEDQRQSKSCTNHPAALSCTACPVSVDVGMCGTPCHPFSTQRATRFQPESVEGHRECEVALSQFLRWLETFEPAVQIFEQVVGFSLPFSNECRETPLDRLLFLQIIDHLCRQ